ncbi:Transcriptional activator HAP2 [Fusarium falciforme]|uniref:Transcriptional activator HAP2 n=1 Tax=Fusarium falciforme TaxID=195108 RepID=UPI00230047DD|nr:Transcriptional activator HAP2 [Fusarium falciforme]WAO94556.1 Transcriptional activator HAP2 [Fusarium falciforme]
MRWPRGPGGRFLTRAKVAAMANGIDGEGDEGCVNDARVAATFQGYINTAFDALIVFEACLSSKLIPIFRRPESTELLELIQSGNVFVYNVEESGIKRWRDDVSWSPGRELENFLVYRELEQPSMPGVKKRDFKKNGLVKKTIGITYQSVTYRLVSYYKCEDVKQGRFLSPSQHPELGRIAPRDELLTQEFSPPINTTGVNSTLDHFRALAPMTYGCSSPVVQQGEISMDYSTEITGFYYAHQHPLLSYLQPQYEEQQHAILYFLPYYSGEQLATPTQPSGADILMQLMKVELYSLDLNRCPLSMCSDNVQDLEKADIERHI